MKRKRRKKDHNTKRIKLNNWCNLFIKKKKSKIKTIKDNPGYKIGLKRLSRILDGCLNKFNITNFQFSNLDLICPTSYHLIFPEIFDRFAKEIAKAVGCSHSKKCATLVSDRGVGKTFSGVLWLVNLIRVVPAGGEIALCGVQMVHATNLLSSISKILHMYDIKNDFDNKPKESIQSMRIKKNGKTTLIRCYPGKGESFRGNNDVVYVLFDEFLFANLEFILEKLLPHYMRFKIGSINMSTKNKPDHPSEMFLKSTKLFEVKINKRLCDKKTCGQHPNWPVRKQCKCSDNVPDQPNQDSSLREELCNYLSEEAAARELYGDTYKTPDFQFENENIEKLLNKDKIKFSKVNHYIVSIDPNLEGASENAIAIFDVYQTIKKRLYSLVYLNSFKSNIYKKKVAQFKEDMNVFVKKINNNKKQTFIFVESNTGNVGADLEDWINKNRYRDFIKVIHGKKWDKRLNRFQNIGIAKTNRRTKCYVENLSTLLTNSSNIFDKVNPNLLFINKDFTTDLKLSYNTEDYQLKKLREQLLRFKNIKGKYTGKGINGDKQDDAAVAFMAGLYMSEELHDQDNRLFSQLMYF